MRRGTEEYIGTTSFTDEITGRTFEREWWEIDSFPGGISQQTRFYELSESHPRRRRVEPLRHERTNETVYGGITLHYRHAGRYTVSLYEGFPFSLSLDEVRVDFRKIMPGFEVRFTICGENGTIFHFMSYYERVTGSRTSFHSDSFELEVNDEKLNDVLRSLENAEQVPRIRSDELASDQSRWIARIVYDNHTTFFYVDGEDTYRLLRYLLSYPIDQVNQAEVGRLREIYAETRQYVVTPHL